MPVWLRLALVVLLASLTACPRLSGPAGLKNTGSSAPSKGAPYSALVPPIKGQVDFNVPGRTTQATAGQIASSATISFIDTTTGYTVGTSVSNSAGSFLLAFSGSWQPTPGDVYYLEAIKGLANGGNVTNGVGMEAARVRTLVEWTNTGMWTSTTGTTIVISPTTTALALILSLRSQTASPIPPSSLINIASTQSGTATAPATYSYSNPSLMPASMVTTAYQEVLTALGTNRDPLDSIALDTSHDLDTIAYPLSPYALAVGSVTPDTQLIGQQVTIKGAGFSTTPTDNTVDFSAPNGATVSATVDSVSPDGTSMTVTVPFGSVSGPVSVTLSGLLVPGPWFYPANTSGHIAVDAGGNLYLANSSFGTISEVSPGGAITTFATGLQAPRNLTIYNNSLYVTCAGSSYGVWVLPLSDPSATTSYGVGSTPDPRGIAFDSSGTLWITDGTANELWSIASVTSSWQLNSISSGPALSNPHGIAFDALGHLYVANYGANTVLSLTLDTTSHAASSTAVASGLAQPWGVAFDSAGDLFISDNSANAVYRLASGGTYPAPFADVPSPGGIVADTTDHLFCVDNTANNVYRMTLAGDSVLFASGFSAPTGIVKVGSDLYVLSSSNNSLVDINTATGALTTIARGFSDPYGLAFDPDIGASGSFFVGNFANGTISQVDRDTGGAFVALAGLTVGTGGPEELVYYGGRLYMRSHQAVTSYLVPGFTGEQTIQSRMQWNEGIAEDTDPTSPNYGNLYIASAAPSNRILRVVGTLGLGGNPLGNAYVTDFTGIASDPNLVNPRDVAVDPNTGNVWAVDNGSDELTSYTPTGATYSYPIAIGANPTGINLDYAGDVWVAAHDGETITGYQMAVHPTQVGQINLSTYPYHPDSLVISNSTMFVAADEGVLEISNYESSPTVTLLNPGPVSITGARDVDLDAQGNLYALSTSNWVVQIATPSFNTDQTDWTLDAGYPLYLYDAPGTTNIYTSGPSMVTDTVQSGNNYYQTYNLAGGSFEGDEQLEAVGVDSNGHVYTDGINNCCMPQLNRIAPGSPQMEWTYTVPSGPGSNYEPYIGSMAADSGGSEYMTKYYGLGVQVVDPNANLSTGWYTTEAALSSADTSAGSWFDGGLLYQTDLAQNEIWTVSPTTWARQLLPYGLGGADM